MQLNFKGKKLKKKNKSQDELQTITEAITPNLAILLGKPY